MDFVLDVSNFDRSKYFRELHPENISFILFILYVLNFPFKLIDFKDTQFLNNP